VRGLLATVVALVVLCCGSLEPSESDAIVLSYEDFGPPAAAWEVLGHDWWQWLDHGDSRPRDYRIKVVVYRNVTLLDVRKAHPVDAAREQDFRYLEYSVSLEYLNRLIAEDLDESVTATLRKTRSKIEDALGPPS